MMMLALSFVLWGPRAGAHPATTSCRSIATVTTTTDDKVCNNSSSSISGVNFTWPGFPGPVRFDPLKHLALQRPARIVRLADFASAAYAPDAEDLATDFAQTSLFNVLSPEGLALLSAEIDRLQEHAVSSPRIPRVLRGTTLRSRFLRDFCHSPELAAFVSDLAGTELIAHPMEIMNGHVNLAPRDASKAVDRWHHDTTPFVMVLFVTPHWKYEGGEFEFFLGTKEEAEVLLLGNGNGEGEGDKGPTGELPPERCRTVGPQVAGSAVFQQGSEVYHRARGVVTRSDSSRGNRTTFVQSFVATNALAREACTRLSDTYNGVDPLEVLLPDWARYRCWRALRLCDHWLTTEGRQGEEDKGGGADEVGSSSSSSSSSSSAEGSTRQQDQQQRRHRHSFVAAAVASVAEKLREATIAAIPYNTADRGAIAAALKATITATERAELLSWGGGGGRSSVLRSVVGTVEGAAHDVASLREPTMSYF